MLLILYTYCLKAFTLLSITNVKFYKLREASNFIYDEKARTVIAISAALLSIPMGLIFVVTMIDYFVVFIAITVASIGGIELGIKLFILKKTYASVQLLFTLLLNFLPILTMFSCIISTISELLCRFVYSIEFVQGYKKHFDETLANVIGCSRDVENIIVFMLSVLMLTQPFSFVLRELDIYVDLSFYAPIVAIFFLTYGRKRRIQQTR